MSLRKVIKQNWITRKLPEQGFGSTLVLVSILIGATFFYWNDIFNAGSWMPVEKTAIFQHHEYWRLWSALFAHADLEHILGNLFLFGPFAYFLSRYFTLWLFPLIGFLLGGFINLLVAATLPSGVALIGVSGVVYWMGATWMTLVFFIDRNDPVAERFLRVTGISLILFFPTTIMPEVSYLSHFLGYIGGVITGALVFIFFKEKILAAEIVEMVDDEELFLDWENYSEDQIHFVSVMPGHQQLLKDWFDRDHVKKECEHEWQKGKAFIVYVDKKPIGVIEQAEVLPGQMQIHSFIADKNLIGKGLGSSYLKKFSDELLENPSVTAVMTELKPSNGAAIRAFKKAGFIKVESSRDNAVFLKEKTTHSMISD